MNQLVSKRMKRIVVTGILMVAAFAPAALAGLASSPLGLKSIEILAGLGSCPLGLVL